MLTVGIVAVALAYVGSQNPSEKAADTKLNVVVILADDLGYGDLSCYGHPKFRTPRIDSLAKDGVRFTQFQTPMPFCAPTRASLLTGRYPFRCGLSVNPCPDAAPSLDILGLPLTEVTLADRLHQAGYATACIGKWHLGHQPQFSPLRRGFDQYLGIPYSNDMRPVLVSDGTKTVEYPVVQATLVKRYVERAVAFINANKAKPFFLYFPHPMPHKPLVASERFYRKSGAGLYGDAIAELDWSVGEVLDALNRNGLADRTLVIFSSDNGAWYGGSNGNLRGMKSVSWEGGYRVPMIARLPGKIPAGKTCHEPAVTMDIFSTVLTATGVGEPTDRKIDGKNLMPLCMGDAKSPHDAIFGQQGPKLATIRMGRWKLHVVPPRKEKFLAAGEKWVDFRAPDGVTILAPFEQAHPSQYPGLKSGVEPKPIMLFDLQADPGEQVDVASNHPEVVARLKKRFDETNRDVKQMAQKGDS